MNMNEYMIELSCFEGIQRAITLFQVDAFQKLLSVTVSETGFYVSWKKSVYYKYFQLHAFKV